MQEKYGFVYIWYDRKHKRYYIGCRWGNENHSYICSSPWMKRAYKRRPQDFKRKILARIYTNKKDLLQEEYKWLSLIKPDELGKRYYNLHNYHFNHWSSDSEKLIAIGEKISLSHKSNPNWGSWSKGKTLTEETKQKLREANKKQFENEEQREMRRKKSLELWNNPDYRKTNTENKKGKKQTPEQIQKRIISLKKRWKETPKKSVPKSDKEKQRISLMSKGTVWINDGEKNKRININDNIPEGFVKGKIRING